MRRLLRIGLAAPVVAGACLGCNRSAVRDKPPPDPLLTSKKSVEGRPSVSRSLGTARLDLPAPPTPGPESATVRTPGAGSGVELTGMRPPGRPGE
jgi:hypothetical protein